MAHPDELERSLAAVDDTENYFARLARLFARGPVIERLDSADWFNHRQLLEPIGNIPPAEAEQRFYAALDAERMAA